MKKYGFLSLFFLILFSSQGFAVNTQSSECNQKFEYEDFVSLGEFLEFLVEFRVYSTSDFLKMKKEEEFPVGIPSEPLKIYSELQGQWSVLWNKAHEIRLSKGEDVPERRRLKKGELRALVSEIFDELEKEGLEEDLIPENSEEALTAEQEQDQDQKRKKSALAERPQTDYTKKQLLKEGGSRKSTADTPSQSKRQGLLKKGGSKKDKRERERKILTALSEDSQMTVAALSERTGASSSTVGKVISNLKREGRLKRVGGRSHSGYWVVVKEGEEFSYQSPQEKRELEILTALSEDSQMTVAALSERTGASSSTVGKVISKLKREGHLKRVGGSSSSGYWVVVKEGEEFSYQSPQEKRELEILTALSEDSQMTVPTLSERTGATLSLVKRVISNLKREGRLKRVGGSSSSGYWVVVKEGEEFSYQSPQEKRELEVLSALSEDSRMTAAALSERTGATLSAVKGVISNLKREGRLKRVGGRSHSGYWVVVKEGEEFSYQSPQEKRELEVLSALSEDSRMTVPALSERTGASSSTVGEVISNLKREGRLKRVGGSSSSGYWVVVKEGEEFSYQSPQEKRELEILTALSEDSQMTVAALSERTGASSSTVGKVISNLKREGRLKRVGGRSHSGYWVVIKEGEEFSYQSPQEKRELEVLSALSEDSRMTVPALSERTGAALSTINKVISNLKREGRLQRIGGNSSSGYWVVVKEESSHHQDPSGK